MNKNEEKDENLEELNKKLQKFVEEYNNTPRADNGKTPAEMFNEKHNEEMTNVKCSMCSKKMEMPKSFLKINNEKPTEHICSDCSEKIASFGGKDKLSSFLADIQGQMDKMGKNNEIAEKIAKDLTDKNIDFLLKELETSDAPLERKLAESFFRGAWTALFLIGNNHELGFLEKEGKKIKDFNDKMIEREKRET